MLNVIIGVGVKVRVVKEDTVIPRNAEVALEPPTEVVMVTTLCGIFRMTSRKWVASLGSSFGVERPTWCRVEAVWRERHCAGRTRLRLAVVLCVCLEEAIIDGLVSGYKRQGSQCLIGWRIVERSVVPWPLTTS